MAVSQRIIGARTSKFNKRIHARGQEMEGKVRRTRRKQENRSRSKEDLRERETPLLRSAPGAPDPAALRRGALVRCQTSASGSCVPGKRPRAGLEETANYCKRQLCKRQGVLLGRTDDRRPAPGPSSRPAPDPRAPFTGSCVGSCTTANPSQAELCSGRAGAGRARGPSARARAPCPPPPTALTPPLTTAPPQTFPHRQTTQAKKSQLPVGPVVLGFFLFVVVGSGAFSLSTMHRERSPGPPPPPPPCDSGPPLTPSSTPPPPHTQNPTALLQIVRSATMGN